jgi:hypothetical protein
MRRSQGLTGSLRCEMVIAQDERGEDRARRFARRALYPPDAHPTQTETDLMRMPCQAPAAMTGRLVFALAAEGQEASDDPLEKRLPVFNHAKLSRFVSKLDGDGAIFAGPFGGLPQVSPLGHQVSSADETRWGEHVAIARQS